MFGKKKQVDVDALVSAIEKHGKKVKAPPAQIQQAKSAAINKANDHNDQAWFHEEHDRFGKWLDARGGMR